MDSVLTGIQQELDKLKSEALEHLDVFWTEQLEINNGKKYQDKSILCARVVTKKDLFYLEWYWNFWVKDSNPKSGTKMKPFSRHLRKGKTFKYPDKTLIGKAKDWEVERVLGWEVIFASIRERVHHLVKARQSARAYLKIESADHGNVEDQEKAS